MGKTEEDCVRPGPRLQFLRQRLIKGRESAS